MKAGQLLFVLDAAEAAAQVNHSTAQAAQVQAQFEDALRHYSNRKLRAVPVVLPVELANS